VNDVPPRAAIADRSPAQSDNEGQCFGVKSGTQSIGTGGVPPGEVGERSGRVCWVEKGIVPVSSAIEARRAQFALGGVRVIAADAQACGAPAGGGAQET